MIPTPLHVLDRISPIFSPFFPVLCALSPSCRGGSNEPQAGAQGQEAVARAPKHLFGGRANSGCWERVAAYCFGFNAAALVGATAFVAIALRGSSQQLFFVLTKSHFLR